MSGSDTFTMVVSSTCSSVPSITASVIMPVWVLLAAARKIMRVSLVGDHRMLRCLTIRRDMGREHLMADLGAARQQRKGNGNTETAAKVADEIKDSGTFGTLRGR